MAYVIRVRTREGEGYVATDYGEGWQVQEDPGRAVQLVSRGEAQALARELAVQRGGRFEVVEWR